MVPWVSALSSDLLRKQRPFGKQAFPPLPDPNLNFQSSPDPDIVFAGFQLRMEMELQREATRAEDAERRVEELQTLLAQRAGSSGTPRERALSEGLSQVRPARATAAHGRCGKSPSLTTIVRTG